MMAGHITPAQVLILGAGVAGLQASPRRGGSGPSRGVRSRRRCREQVKSLGAAFVEMECPRTPRPPAAMQGNVAGSFS